MKIEARKIHATSISESEWACVDNSEEESIWHILYKSRQMVIRLIKITKPKKYYAI